MTNAQKAQLENRLMLLIQRQSELERLFPNFDNLVMDTIHEETSKEAQAIQKQLATRREFLFNFMGGGWNSEYAHTLEEAQQLATEKYQSEVDLKSFRVSTPADYNNLLSLFH
jgi:hypothetical protein